MRVAGRHAPHGRCPVTHFQPRRLLTPWDLRHGMGAVIMTSCLHRVGMLIHTAARVRAYPALRLPLSKQTPP